MSFGYAQALTATASHILVGSESLASDLKQQIADGADFAEIAAEHSTCPSGKRGGSLGTFGKGQMVKEFDAVVFAEDVGVVHGPIATQFGFHLILIIDRTDA